MTKDEALKLEALKYAASKGYGRDLLNMISAPFTIKEAVAQPEQPPQRPWVGLTVDELITLEQKHMRHEDLSRAIEAKLKAVNGFHSTEKNTWPTP